MTTNADAENGEEVQYSPLEEKALEQGWVPQDEWEGDPDEWVPAKEFVYRGELMGRIKSQTRAMRAQQEQINQLSVALNELGEINKNIAKVEYEKAVSALKKDKARALEEDEFDKVVEIDEQLAELKNKVNVASSTKQETARNQEEVHPDVANWLEQNPWYKEDEELRDQADSFALLIKSKNPEWSPGDVLEQVDKKMKTFLGHKNENNSKPKAFARRLDQKAEESDAAGVTKGGTKGKSKYTPANLTPDQRKIGETFVATGAMKSLQDYVDQLAAIGGFDV